jgi:hypothetical protein
MGYVRAFARFVIALRRSLNTVSSISARNHVQSDVCNGTDAPSGRRQIDSIGTELRQCRIFTELIPMPDIQVDRYQMAPSILPADIPELSDDECLACLARAVETHDSARLDEVAALIGRLAVTIE